MSSLDVFEYAFRLSESPDRLGSVFNAEYNVSPARNKNPPQARIEANGTQDDEIVPTSANFQSSEPSLPRAPPTV